MPVFQLDPQARDFWGYNPLSFFAPHRGYAPRGSSPIDAFRAMVAALHDAGIEVVLDAVYNTPPRPAPAARSTASRASTTARTT